MEEVGSSGAWTDEKHSSFLNRMEASFVRWMLFGGRFAHAADSRGSETPLPLDRYLPDGADSTRDCRKGKRGRRRTAARRRESRRDCLSRARKPMQRRYIGLRSQDDQVSLKVTPEFEGENVRPRSSEVVSSAAMDEQHPAE